MNKIILFLAKKYKKEPFSLDSDISGTYLFMFCLRSIFKLIRGFINFKNFNKKILVGKNTVILSKENIFISGSSFHIDSNCYIDALSENGITVGHAVSIQKEVIIECTGSLSKIGKGLVLGDNVGIGSRSFLGCAGGVEIGNDTIIGNYVSFHSENHNIDDIDKPIRMQGVIRKGITVGNNCWIGAKVTILDGANIGNGCVIAAGCVVIAGIYPKNSIIGGVPAKIMRVRE